ncbi:MAG: aldo/keto reductase, partial [Bacteroidetes bacterium]|nr:aldo/keto reductase [Bacteroidota bacterium]
MQQNYFESSLGQTGIKVQRLGLSGTYRPGVATIHKAFDEGLNYFFCYGIDTQMIKVLRDISKSKRENLIIATGAYNLLVGHPNLRRTLEKRLRQLGTDYIDVFLFLGVMKQKHFGKRELEEMIRFREEGKVRSIGISCHNRKFAGELAASGVLDVVMIRYNAAHRGAELDIFPYLKNHNTGVVGYTATRWKYLMRRPKAWSKDKPLPTAGMCYRFVLSNPNIHVCMTAPSNLKQLEENLAAFRKG